MNLSTRNVVVIAMVTLGLGAAAGFGIARLRPDSTASDMNGAQGGGDRPALYWYDPMVPNQHFDKPGKSPFMDMQLVPKYAGSEEGSDASIRIQPGVIQNLGIRLTTVERGTLASSTEAPGVVQYDQSRSAVVQTRVSGFVQGIHGHSPGDVVKAGSPLIDLLVPTWAAAQAEFVTLVRSGDAVLVAAAKQRLLLQGMPSALIARLERTQQPETSFTIASPIAGAIESLDARPGMTLDSGATVARIAGLDSIWVEASVPLRQGAVVNIGRPVEVRIASGENDVLKGVVTSILPEASTETRTLRVRISLENPQRSLRPGMFAQVRLGDSRSKTALLVASEAIIRSGTRNIVFVADGGRFIPKEVELGAESAGRTEIVRGLTEGQQVVASGQFLIDSEANLQGLLARLSAAATMPAEDAMTELHEAAGKVTSLSADEVVISHGPIASMQWPAMTMNFRLKDGAVASGLKSGDAVRFWFRKEGEAYVIERTAPAETRP